MAILNDNFDSYSNGDLTGQGSWSGDVAYDVQSTTVQSGTKAVTIGASANLACINVIGDTTTGSQEFYMRFGVLGTDGNLIQVQFTNSADGFMFRVQLYRNASGDYRIRIIATETADAATGLSADVWYKCVAVWDGTQVKLKVDSGSYTTLSNYAASGPVNKIKLRASTSSGDSGYWDSF